MTVTNRVSQDWLQYCATQEQLDTFNNDGYLIVEEALTPQIIDQLAEVINRVDYEERKKQKLSNDVILSKFCMVVEDDIFLELLD